MTEHYLPSSDQVAFADSVGKSLASMLPLSRLHESHEESPQTWAALRELGVFGICAPEADGGSDLGATEEALIVLELGRWGVAPTVLSTIGVTHLRTDRGALPAGSDQRVAAAYRYGGSAAGGGRDHRIVWVEDARAALLLVRHESGAGLFERPATSQLVDPHLWACRLVEAAVLGQPLAQATPAQALRLRLIDAAALAGIARAALDMAVGYAGIREQFGRPIGSFQAVKHHCADMALAARCAADQVGFAAVAVDRDADDATLQVESAFYVAGTAAINNCNKNIQVHGGMGFSDEADPHLLLKRTRVLLEIGGGLEAALIRIGNCVPAA